MQRKRDMWPWNPELLRYVILFLITVTLIIVLASYPCLGHQSLYFLFIGFTAPLIGLIYGFVGKKVRLLKDSVSTEEGDIEESLIVIDNIQSPGVAILSLQELRLIPIVGKEVLLNMSAIKSVRRPRFFNGKSLIWKRWLVLSTSPRLGFALPEPTAEHWFKMLSETLKSSTLR